MNLWMALFVLVVIGAGTLLFLSPPAVIRVTSVPTRQAPETLPPTSSFLSPEASLPTSTNVELPRSGVRISDIERQSPLSNPPAIVKGIYATSWSAGSPSKRKYFIDLVGTTELNGIVLDIKDYSGFVSYRTDVPEVKASGAENDLRILYPNKLIKEMHDRGIYVIGRVSVFQDSVLAKVHPEWAMKNKTTGEVWTDRKGLAWLDPAERKVWEYNAAIAKDAIRRGFDEINFDYVRFASDGDLSNVSYPAWDAVTPKHAVIRNFFLYLRTELPSAKISVDLFGLATVNSDDLGIGQIIEDGFENFDYVSPMVYPSHYQSGFLGYKNPAQFPHEVVFYSLERAFTRLAAYGREALATSTLLASSTFVLPPPLSRTRIRPWLQSFDLGATYDAEKVRAQIQAVEDALVKTIGMSEFAGWLLWSPSNVYARSALRAE